MDKGVLGIGSPAGRVGLGLFVVSLCLTAAGLGAEWTPAGYNLQIQTHFNHTVQQHAGSVTLTLEHTQGVTLTVAAAGAGKEVFTCQSPGSSDTLVTKYKLTGADLGAAADSQWVGSSDFISPSRSYPLPYTDGVSQVTLQAQGTSSGNRANDAGAYSASLVITAAW